MLSVLGRVDCSQVLLEIDPWIPLKVSWEVPRSGQPLYFRVSGDEGGEVELKVDSATGVLLQVVVVDMPPEFDGYEFLAEAGHPECQVPVLDRSMWEWKVTPDYTEPVNSIARSVERLRMTRKSNVVTLVFSAQLAVEYVGCGPVCVGVSAGGELVSIVAVE